MERSVIAKQRLEKKISREVAILHYLKHPHLVRVYEAIVQEKQVHVVMEYAPGGELFDLVANMGHVPEYEARPLFQQLISALEYCHNHSIVHRDIKPENILLDESRHIKLADFGLSNVMKAGTFLLTPCGSPNYAAPEVITGK